MRGRRDWVFDACFALDVYVFFRLFLVLWGLCCASLLRMVGSWKSLQYGLVKYFDVFVLIGGSTKVYLWHPSFVAFMNACPRSPRYNGSLLKISPQVGYRTK